jgi:hypothetical protein
LLSLNGVPLIGAISVVPLYFKLIDLLRSNAGSWYLFAALFTSCYQFLAKTPEPQW